MFDIDKELKALGAEKIRPDEDLRQRTRRMVTGAALEKHTKKQGLGRLVYYPIAAVIAIIMLVAVLLTAPAEAAGYYTIDINASISVAVDSGDNVLYVTAKNDEAKDLISGLKLGGLPFHEALEAIVKAAVCKEYLKEQGHLLVAYFGDDEGMPQSELDTIVREQLLETGVAALSISGDMQDFKKAEKSGRKAGIELLLSGAREAGIEDKDIGSVISDMSEKQRSKGEKSGGKGKSSKSNEQGPAHNGSNGNSGPQNKNKDKVKEEKKKDEEKENKDKGKDKEKEKGKGKDNKKDKEKGKDKGKDKDKDKKRGNENKS